MTADDRREFRGVVKEVFLVLVMLSCLGIIGCTWATGADDEERTNIEGTPLGAAVTAIHSVLPPPWDILAASALTQAGNSFIAHKRKKRAASGGDAAIPVAIPPEIPT